MHDIRVEFVYNVLKEVANPRAFEIGIDEEDRVYLQLVPVLASEFMDRDGVGEVLQRHEIDLIKRSGGCQLRRLVSDPDDVSSIHDTIEHLRAANLGLCRCLDPQREPDISAA